MKPARVVLVAASCFSIVFISALSIAKAQSGIASIYSGGRTANGEKAAASGMTAAHKTLPFGTLVRVTHQRSGRSVVVRVNDRGPFVANRDLDLTLGAGTLLGLQGLGTVYMEVLSIPPVKHIRRPVVESLFAVNDANANCIGVSAC